MNKKEISNRLKFWKQIANILVKEKNDGRLERSGICICYIIDKLDNPFGSTVCINHTYPELEKYRPKRGWTQNDEYFWSPQCIKGYEKRKSVVNKIINDLQKQL